MVKILTPHGVIEEKNITDIETQPIQKPIIQPSQKLTPPAKREAMKNWNKSPPVKQNGIIAVSTFQVWAVIGIIGFLTLMIIAMSVWFNLSFNQKDFSTNITNQIDVAPAQTEIKNDYTHEIYNQPNITIVFPDELIVKLQNETV